jgi:hypothetical protein
VSFLGEQAERGTRTLWTKRIKDLIALVLVGDGVLTLIAARDRALLWRFGPERLRKSTSWQADHPLYMRLEGIASIGIGMWLALRQYQEPPRPWYRRWL